MTKQTKKTPVTQTEQAHDTQENAQASETSEVETTVENALTETSSTVETSADEKAAVSGEKEAQTDAEQPVSHTSPTPNVPKKAKKCGGIFIPTLIALACTGAALYFAYQHIEQKVSHLENQVQTWQTTNPATSEPVIVNFDAEKKQLTQLSKDYQETQSRLSQLESERHAATQQINALQTQVQKLGATPENESSSWRYAEADFLLNNALRKVVWDNDIDTARSLLVEADNVLSQISDVKVVAVREAVKADLQALSEINPVDQHKLMQRLAALANLIDDLPLAVNHEHSAADNSEVSDSLDDWQKNLEKSADSFLSHFIRVSDKNSLANEKAFIAPNQEIYLRENIRLRLQIAMMAIPRQQGELYKQSVEAVGRWVRSYFDTDNHGANGFLKEVDELAEQSIYIDAPTRLQSLDLLSQQLNRTAKPIAKIQLEAEKALPPVKEEANQAASQTKPKAEPEVDNPQQVEPHSDAGTEPKTE